jgi:hypothetical protein
MERTARAAAPAAGSDPGGPLGGYSRRDDRIAPEDVTTSVVWWHARDNANVPLQAVERIVRRMPRVELRLWEHAGHRESYRREPELLAQLREPG